MLQQPAFIHGGVTLLFFSAGIHDWRSMRMVDLMCTAGGSSCFKRLPLGRYFHDMRTGLYHPPDSDETLEMPGRAAFGIPPSDKDTLWA
jgi:hypothetical protein